MVAQGKLLYVYLVPGLCKLVRAWRGRQHMALPIKRMWSQRTWVPVPAPTLNNQRTHDDIRTCLAGFSEVL